MVEAFTSFTLTPPRVTTLLLRHVRRKPSAAGFERFHKLLPHRFVSSTTDKFSEMPLCSSTMVRSFAGSSA